MATLSRVPSMSSSSSGSTISVRRQYFRKIGNINLLRDKIFNLESDLQLDQNDRDEQIAAGQSVEPSDEKFYADYFARREAIVREYWSTKAEMESLGRHCHSQGIDVQPANLPPFIDQIFGRNEDFILPNANKNNPDKISDAERNIMHWVRHVHRMSEPEPSLSMENIMTDREAEKLLLFPLYQHLQASTDLESQAITNQVAQSAPHSHNFEGELPTAGRRYSAPILSYHHPKGGDTLAPANLNVDTHRVHSKRRDQRSTARRATSEL
jgi:hypothetical protein